MAFPTYAKLKNEPARINRTPAVLRTEMESGPPKQAKVRSRVLVQRKLVYVFATRTDYTNFLTWFAGEAAYGAAWFAWIDPLDGSTKQARIVDGALDESIGYDEQPTFEIGMTIETWDA